MEELMMEPDSVEMSGPEPHHGVADAWETVSAALVSGFYPRILVDELTQRLAWTELHLNIWLFKVFVFVAIVHQQWHFNPEVWAIDSSFLFNSAQMCCCFCVSCHFCKLNMLCMIRVT